MKYIYYVGTAGAKLTNDTTLPRAKKLLRLWAKEKRLFWERAEIVRVLLLPMNGRRYFCKRNGRWRDEWDAQYGIYAGQRCDLSAAILSAQTEGDE